MVGMTVNAYSVAMVGYYKDVSLQIQTWLGLESRSYQLGSWKGTDYTGPGPLVRGQWPCLAGCWPGQSSRLADMENIRNFTRAGLFISRFDP